MEDKNFILKGNIVYSKNSKELEIIERGYLVCKDGYVEGAYNKLKDEFKEYPLEDYGDNLIIPGFIDLHTHASQYAYRGTGMDMELIKWLEVNAFPEEAKFKDLDYASKAYNIFTENLRKSVTTRACIFTTVHKDGTLLLMDMLEDSGLCTMVGKVNMDRNCPDYIKEKSAIDSAKTTIDWIKETINRNYKNTYPILTPRFTPSCTDELMKELKKIQVEYHLSLQSHLSENIDEIKWVKELCPWSNFYGEAYSKFGLFGNDTPTLMAHCVYSNDEELKLIKDNNVFIVHCPESNMNVSSGIAPIRKYIDLGLHVGLGSDVSGGSDENMFKHMALAIQSSKIRWRLLDQSLKALTLEEAFYMASKGGGEFFGKVGSFDKGYEFDAVVLDDSRLKHPQTITTKDRLERMIYLADNREVKAKYVRGNKLF